MHVKIAKIKPKDKTLLLVKERKNSLSICFSFLSVFVSEINIQDAFKQN